MFLKEDTTYNDMRHDSMMQWLEQLVDGEDKVNKSGARLTIEYIEHLNRKIEELEKKSALKDDFLKRLKEKNSAK